MLDKLVNKYTNDLEMKSGFGECLKFYCSINFESVRLLNTAIAISRPIACTEAYGFITGEIFLISGI